MERSWRPAAKTASLAFGMRETGPYSTRLTAAINGWNTSDTTLLAAQGKAVIS